MNNVIDKVENLKEYILNCKEYNDFKKYERLLDSNNEIKNIIMKIKQLQQKIIKLDDKNQNTEREEIELQSLYKKLNKYNDYTNYIKSSKKLNDILTYIQKSFEDYFNKFLL